MVLADRNDDSRIGRRSHTSSPNGHLTDEGSATDESEQDHGMRVGHDFQAVIPDIISATGEPWYHPLSLGIQCNHELSAT
ncbi:hypothetical protein HPB51_024999 [Rhipicephalus microplus]|uniref:Uncharacterized protein n=1 Tax=Rhipicephalus microplus TaxID=6941 RepID=A0A9J6E5C3_RHIMP|nr:hypothetical protein HPB51_024999 [Rhipicephalus microplus]